MTEDREIIQFVATVGRATTTRIATACACNTRRVYRLLETGDLACERLANGRMRPNSIHVPDNGDGFQSFMDRVLRVRQNYEGLFNLPGIVLQAQITHIYDAALPADCPRLFVTVLWSEPI